MSMTLVFTLTGTDRIGIVDEITRSFLEIGGNIEASRMARLGGEFAVIMLVTLPVDKQSALDQTVADLVRRGYKVTTTETKATGVVSHRDWRPYRLEVSGADHEGIVNRIAHTLSEHGINIETADTDSNHAPNSGILLFNMRARVLVPPHLDEGSWRQALTDAAQEQHVDIVIEPAPEALS
ncbi:MAG: hypothetical protein A2X81_00790 [Desulfobacterales bacterium GWB2_56_26]|nr:MAG: hypothetical protein A2X81_00790 [Desulfobacterales bacterium GWB2_56_26]